jgi:MutS domain V
MRSPTCAGKDAIQMILWRQEMQSTCGSREADYKIKLADLEQNLSSAQRRRSRSLFSLIGCAALLVVSLTWSGHLHSSWVATIPAVGLLFYVSVYVMARKASLQIALRRGFYERGLERLHFDWNAFEHNGEKYARANHLYQTDLQIIGDRSLFSLLCTTRSEAGAACLAKYLLDPVDLEEVIARQAAVHELHTSTGLREAIALLGRNHFRGCDHEVLNEWMSTPVLNVHWMMPVFSLLCGLAFLLLAVSGLAHIIDLVPALPICFALLVAQVAICAPIFSSTRSRLKTLRRLAGEVSVLQEGFNLLQIQQFTCPKLARMVENARASNASTELLRLDRLLQAIAQRDKELFVLLSLLMAAGTQLVLAVERWRASNSEQFGDWLNVWAEFDALNAIAGYAWEHPDHVFPEALNGSPTLRLQDMGHPLLPADHCVRNGVVLNESHRFWILSGSNMAGKSTLLRAIGMNLVLAGAGAPVCATSAQLSVFTICTSISITDSVLDGRSKFMAEAERLQKILSKTVVEQPVLFLIDEILSGTNSQDRRVVCEAIVRSLHAGGAMGVLSTHDLALTAIGDESGLNGLNCCMESEDPAEPLKFNYRVKSGISRSSSAIAIIRLLGIDI